MIKDDFNDNIVDLYEGAPVAVIPFENAKPQDDEVWFSKRIIDEVKKCLTAGYHVIIEVHFEDPEKEITAEVIKNLNEIGLHAKDCKEAVVICIERIYEKDLERFDAVSRDNVSITSSNMFETDKFLCWYMLGKPCAEVRAKHKTKK